MVDVGGRKREPELRFAEQVKQRHRVAAARQRDQHRRSDKIGKGALEVLDKLRRVHELHATSDACNWFREWGIASPLQRAAMEDTPQDQCWPAFPLGNRRPALVAVGRLELPTQGL